MAIGERTLTADRQAGLELSTEGVARPVAWPKSRLVNGFERVDEDPLEDREDSERTQEIMAEKKSREATRETTGALGDPRGDAASESLNRTTGSPRRGEEGERDPDVTDKHQQERSLASDAESLVPENQLKISKSEKKQVESSDDSDASSEDSGR